MTKFGAAYYAELRRRLHGLKDALAERFDEKLNTLLADLIDANEPGVALQMLVEALSALDAPVPSRLRAEAIALAKRMKMTCLVEQAERLTPG